MSDKKSHITAGLLAISFFLIHAGALVHAGEYYHIIWSCHLGCLIVGIGLLYRLKWLLAIGFFWLTMGVPLWLLNVLTRHEYMLTSTLSHIGGIVKWREIYEHMESATDRCEDVANVLEGVALKHA